jgi:hypothetical protein
MKTTNKAHTIRFFPNVAAGAAGAATWDLNNVNRNMMLKSIAWDYQIVRAVTFEPIPLTDNDFMLVHFGTQAGIPNHFSHVFENIAGTAAFITGENVWFFEPKQYLFNGFYLSNVLGFFLTWNNLDLANAYVLYCTVLIETEDTDIKGL